MFLLYVILFVVVVIANALLLKLLALKTKHNRTAWLIGPIGWAICGVLTAALTYIINMHPIVNFLVGFAGAFVGIIVGFCWCLAKSNRRTWY